MTLLHRGVESVADLSLVSNGGASGDETPPEMYPTEELGEGTQLGEYTLHSRLGSGGCGVVYLATHRGQDRPVAIKILHGHLTLAPKVVTRFLREIEMIELLHHPHIVAIESTGALVDGRPYYVMEYLGETTLATLCRDQGTFSVSDCVQILTPVCSALAAAHNAGIVHRDIKASNISVRRDAEQYIVKLLDFGVAKLGRNEADGTGFTTRGRIVGTLHVMAPEQIRGQEIDHRADIYALGALLYRMLTGRVLFYSGLAMEVVLRHLEEPAPKPSLLVNVSKSVDAVVLRCLEKDPAKRFQSVSAFIEALKLAADEEAAQAERSRGEIEVGVGISVEVAPREDTDELDEELCDLFQQALDHAEHALASAGFSMVLATGTALLGVLLLSGGEGDPFAEERKAKLLGASLREELRAMAADNGRISVVVSTRVDKVYVDRGAELRFLGGPLLHTEDWATSPETLVHEDFTRRKRDSNAA